MSNGLPQGWTIASLANLTVTPKHDIISGPFGSNLKSDEYVATGVPIIRLQNVDRNRFIEKNMRFITSQKAQELSAHRFQAGDIVITKLGDPLGKACVVPDSLPNGVVVADVVRVRIDESRFCKPYTVYAINSPAVVNQINQEIKGSTRPRVNLNHLRDLEIPLAPLSEQRRIVAKLKKILAKVETSQKSLTKIPVLIKHFRQSVLTAACTGRLTADWREQNEEADVFSKDGKDFPELPSSWYWIPISELSKVETGTTPPKYDQTNYSTVTTDCPFFKPTDLNNGFYVREAREWISKKGERFARILPPLTVCVTSIGATIGKTGLLRVRGATNQQINSIVPCDKVHPLFTFFFCCSPYFQQRIIEESSSTTLPIINKGRFEQLEFPLPPLTEQKEIIRRVESLFTLADKIETRYQKAHEHVDRLTQSILAKAFRGELVIQDPNDEPANVLLARIKGGWKCSKSART
jgi:type I restriction enzyme S subunit